MTVPLTGKAAVTCETRFTLPVSVRVCDTDPLVTVATRYALSMSDLAACA